MGIAVRTWVVFGLGGMILVDGAAGAMIASAFNTHDVWLLLFGTTMLTISAILFGIVIGIIVGAGIIIEGAKNRMRQGKDPFK